MKPEPSLLLAQLLDLHLTRTIDRLKGDDVMSKFTELADGIRSDLQNFDRQADELMTRREDLRQRGERVFAKHRENQDEVHKGLDELEAALRDLEGGNSKNGREGSGDSSGSSFRKE